MHFSSQSQNNAQPNSRKSSQGEYQPKLKTHGHRNNSSMLMIDGKQESQLSDAQNPVYYGKGAAIFVN